MDLIGNIKHIESKLGGRSPNQPQKKSALKNTRNVVVNDQEQPHSADKNPPSVDDERLLGRNIDTIA